MSKAKLPKDHLRAVIRQRKAMELRVAGKTYWEIADELGVSYRTAYLDVLNAYKRTADLSDLDVEKARRIELDRLDRLYQRAWAAVENGSLQAIDTALRIITRRAALQGLDTNSPPPPQEHVIKVVGFDPERL
ncbi:MAG: hypothetical protein GYA36_17400 [Veillonellaceae bacterium]|nr:hypothetical protein [Veillonellaceae bacterium]